MNMVFTLQHIVLDWRIKANLIDLTGRYNNIIE